MVNVEITFTSEGEKNLKMSKVSYFMLLYYVAQFPFFRNFNLRNIVCCNFVAKMDQKAELVKIEWL